jgi:hypothetical protein
MCIRIAMPCTLPPVKHYFLYPQRLGASQLFRGLDLDFVQLEWCADVGQAPQERRPTKQRLI